MTTATAFADALSHFRELGGAMLYLPADHWHFGRWRVSTYEEIAESSNDGDALAATRHAMKQGGMTPEQIEAELADWQEAQP